MPFTASFYVLLLFFRFAIDTMQSVCLDEFGGEKVVHTSSQETTLIQHVFGGQLQSQVLSCSRLSLVQNQFACFVFWHVHDKVTSAEELL